MNKNALISLMLTALLCALLLSACGAPQEQAAEVKGYTFTDDLGRTVTVEKPQRVAALLGSFAQIWQLAGGNVCATADDAWKDLALELSEDTVDLGSTENLSLELLLASSPDLILASSNRRQNMEWQDTLERTGIPVAYFDVTNFEDYLHMLRICTEITGCADRYETYGTAVQTQIDAVLERNRERAGDREPITVLTLRASASALTVKNSGSTVLGEMLSDLGCVNIADSETSLLENLSMETVMTADPDYIFIVQRGDDTEGMQQYLEQFFADHPEWAGLTAVKEGRVYQMDKLLFNLKPNARWGEAYEILEEILQNG